ncbi:hypothetical protein KUL42_09910 [Alteromonas sp. KUL42]|uniref:DUF6950 family protein n=1 Tax=Alteromonas sp. KUL42 TaxID=2480797 RepID=UPI001036E4C9|nr:hypothetical protein [Alteromonas sp. KUL42]TAP37780.1 hypothetical protein EYR97_04925 [Alteromonas sp. KUL42]GEA06230.1 hypothetical protein KUL42_09910 [Alteromonas sp. KUL42]
MQRYTDWATRLTQFMQSRQYSKFQWGKHDCCLFAADAVLAMTGHDYAKAFRGRYRTSKGALLALKRKGYAGIDEALTAILGEPSPRLSVRRGDVVLIKHNGEDTAGIMFGDVVVPSTLHLETVSPLSIQKVWRVG